LLQLIPRLYDPDQGAIYISGYNIRDLEERFLRDHIGYVPQEVHLFSGTIRDNIVWGKEEATEEQIMEAARDAQIDALIRKLPNGYETVLGQKGVNLSGGQKQRLSIARALLRRPKILLLDDCTSALDATTEARLLQALKKYQCTTLMITQKMSAMMNADRILILDHGRLAAFGTHAELLESSELYQKIWHSQMESEERRHA
jgi:ATP-binding cassette subfamily B multidrug efflux pump